MPTDGPQIEAIFNEMLKKRTAIYYDTDSEYPQYFDKLDIATLEKYFKNGGKEQLFSNELMEYFEHSTEGQKRIEHTFAVFLLGIYCYDSIEKIKNTFNTFIEDKIWKGIGYTAEENEGKSLRQDFLYLWFLTALFHDMGYMYENDKEKSKYYCDIINNRSMMSKENLGSSFAINGIPKKIRNSATNYFWQRQNNPCFHHELCTDHGFAGGYILYNTLKKLHKEGGAQEDNTGIRPVDNYLLFHPSIFRWYNQASVWAIICHNIWLAEAGTERAGIYEKFGLKDLIFSKNKSPISYKKHPLLFLLDLIDTLDPLKRFPEDSWKKIHIMAETDKLILTYKSDSSCDDCILIQEKWKKLKEDLAFLHSDSFMTEIEQNKIIFMFK